MKSDSGNPGMQISYLKYGLLDLIGISWFPFPWFLSHESPHKRAKLAIAIYKLLCLSNIFLRPAGLMDKALVFGTSD